MMSTSNKCMVTLECTGWDQPELACATPLQEKPLGGGYVRVFVNSLAIIIRSGSKDGYAYWSFDGGRTALEYHELDVGARLYWNAQNAFAWQLEAGTPIEFDYEVETGLPPTSI